MLNNYNSFGIMMNIPRDEEVLWSGKPNKTCYILEAIFNPFLVFALIWGSIDMLFIAGGVLKQDPGLILFFAIHMFPVWIYLYGALLSGLRYKNTEYIVTNKKIYISTGVFKKSCRIKLYRQLSDITTHQGLFDKKLFVGDVEMIDPNDFYYTKHGRRYNKFIIADVPDYKHVYKLIMDIYSQYAAGKKEITVENDNFDYQGNYTEENNAENYPYNSPYDYYDNPDRNIDI